MKSRSYQIIWAVALIAAGIFFLGQETGLISNVPPVFWAAFLAGASLIFFATYFIEGVRHWWWLFPALIFGAVALTIILTVTGHSKSYVAAPILAGTAIPFVVAFGVDTKHNWWALIPAWVMSVLTVVVLIADYAPGELIGTIVMLAIALPFVVVYLIDRSRWWALIPAGVMAITGVIPILTMGLREDLVGPFVMILFAIPFVVVYLWSPRNWWAFIPTGVFATIGLASLFASGNEAEIGNPAVVTGVLFCGWALTFASLWLRRAVHPTGWALYPAAGLAVAGLVAFGFGLSGIRFITPLIIIAAGVIVLFVSLRRGQE